MINEERWINSLTKKNQEEINYINSEKWVDTLGAGAKHEIGQAIAKKIHTTLLKNILYWE